MTASKPPSGGSGVSNKELGYQLRQTRALEAIAQSLAGIHTELARVRPALELPDYGTPPPQIDATGLQDSIGKVVGVHGLYFPDADDHVSPMGHDDM